MPRTIPTTSWWSSRYDTFIEDINGINLEDINWIALEWISWVEVNKIDTAWVKARAIDCLTWDESWFEWDETELAWDDTCWWIVTAWDTPRYESFIEDLNWINLEDIDWVDLEWISWGSVNKIDTTWV